MIQSAINGKTTSILLLRCFGLKATGAVEQLKLMFTKRILLSAMTFNERNGEVLEISNRNSECGKENMIASFP